VTALGIAVRWAHLGAVTLVVGAFAMLLLAGRSRGATGRVWESRVLAWSQALLGVALGSGLAALAWQAAVAEGRWRAALDPGALVRLVLETQGGHVWLARQALLLVLAAFVAMRPDGARPVDWLATRGEAALLALAALGLAAAGGHAAAAETQVAAAVAVDALHLLAAGAWIGGLVPLAVLLRSAAREDGADARPYAVVAAWRFSRMALAAFVVLGLSGIWNAIATVGSVAGLVGTPYGRLLLAKLALLIPVVAVAASNRRRLLPDLSGDGDTIGRPAMRRLAASVATESALALALLGVVAALGVTPPARHAQPSWPFAHRLTLALLADAPDLRFRALLGSQIAALGAAGLLASLVLSGRRLLVVPPALALLAGGLAIAVPPLTVDAYPTTYLRPAAPYHATSIAQGARLYHASCATCHGPGGAGDGPGGRGLPRPPADLRAPHTGQHTAGDLFWWITHGIPASGMPPFGDRLSEQDRWDLINFVRALAGGQQARFLPAAVQPRSPSLVAPDFSFTVGPMPARALRDYRGRRIVLVVLYSLPGSQARLEQIAQVYDLFALVGVEVIAVPRQPRPDAIRQLGGAVRILYPVVTEGAEEIAAAYDLFGPTAHAEFLVDRQGYLRLVWAPWNAPDPDVRPLLAAIEQLNGEPASAPAADEHVH
jgi:putative copper resistance protein D